MMMRPQEFSDVLEACLLVLIRKLGVDRITLPSSEVLSANRDLLMRRKSLVVFIDRAGATYISPVEQQSSWDWQI